MPIPLSPDTCKMGVFIRYADNEGNTQYAIIRGRMPAREERGEMSPEKVVLESPRWTLENANALMGIPFEKLHGAEILNDFEVLAELYRLYEKEKDAQHLLGNALKVSGERINQLSRELYELRGVDDAKGV